MGKMKRRKTPSVCEDADTSPRGAGRGKPADSLRHAAKHPMSAPQEAKARGRRKIGIYSAS